MEDKEKKTITEKTALARMMRICARKEYCANDIRNKLIRLYQSEEAIQRIISQLQKNKFIEDARYTRSYINDKLLFSKWGKTKIVYMLRSKQISDQIIEEAFADIAPQELTASLESILKKKLKHTKGNSIYERRNKVIRYALGRGFALSDIVKYLDRIINEEE